MEIRVSTRRSNVGDGERALIVEKIERLSKYLPGMESAEVHFFAERNPRIADKEVCEVTLEGHGHHLRCKANGPDHLTAVDRAVEKLENKMHRLKTKLVRKPSHRDTVRLQKLAQAGTAFSVESALGANEEASVVATLSTNGTGTTEDIDVRIVRTKKVEKLVLSPEDAAMRMDLVSHDFYFFTNIDTGRAAVVYRRDDGDVGLIDETG